MIVPPLSPKISSTRESTPCEAQKSASCLLFASKSRFQESLVLNHDGQLACVSHLRADGVTVLASENEVVESLRLGDYDELVNHLGQAMAVPRPQRLEAIRRAELVGPNAVPIHVALKIVHRHKVQLASQLTEADFLQELAEVIGVDAGAVAEDEEGEVDDSDASSTASD